MRKQNSGRQTDKQANRAPLCAEPFGILSTTSNGKFAILNGSKIRETQLRFFVQLQLILINMQ